MVTWVGDGTLSGYNSTTKRLENYTYRFASPGTVDLNGITRLQYGLTSDLPNRLTAQAVFTFTEADAPQPPSGWEWSNPWVLSAAMYIAPARNFAAGVTPKPSEILAAKEIAVYRADYYVTGATTRTFNIPGPLANELAPGTKFWVLVLPTQLLDPASPWSVANDRPHEKVNVDTFGRALSVWTNRTPSAPVITSPAAKSAVAPGGTFTLAFTPVSADAVNPNEATRSNIDLAGVQVQYAPVASVANPNPFWRDLPYYDVSGNARTAAYVLGQKSPSPGRKILDDLSLPITVASDSAPPLTGLLPGGDWQLRVRTADFGSPYPTLVNSPDNKTPGVWTMNSYPSANVSEWSNVVVVSVPSQVPPPIPLTPTSNLAVVEGTVRLAWNYRNTHLPPFAQAQRAVQIRKVGDPNWATVYSGMSPASFVDLPRTIDNPTPIPSTEYISDGGFENGTLGGWGDGGDSDGLPLLNVSAQPSNSGSHSGSRYLSSRYYQHYFNGSPQGINAGFTRNVPLSNPDHTRYTFDGWVGVGSSTGSLIVQAYWLNSSGGLVGSPILNTSTVKPSGGWTTFWNRIGFTADKPAGAVSLGFVIKGLGDSVSGELRLDDMSLVGSYPFNTDDFTMSALNQYEWRVQTTDTDGVTSQFSQPARFWMVPVPASGEEIPTPTETVEGATLGCGKHRVFAYRRGGAKRIAEITGLSSVKWGRVRDDISTAKIEVSGWDEDCGKLLARLESWAYEIVIYRDNGYTIDRVWEGPITLPTYEVDKVTINAKDVMVYPYRRIIKQAMNDSGKGNGTTVVDRAKRVLQNVLAPDDPNMLAYLQVFNRSDDVVQYRSTPPYSRTAFEEIDDMASNQGLDYTVVGRAILLWGTKNRIGTLPMFTDNDLGASPIVSEYGMSAANVYAISDGNGTHGQADRLNDDGVDPIYGLVEMLSSSWASDSPEDSGTYSQEGLETISKSFEASAERSLAPRYPPPVVVRVPDNTSLNPGMVLSIQQLVPGVAIPLRSTSTLRTVKQTQKLDSVTVTEVKGVETIKVTMSPFAQDDATGGEGGEEA